MKDGYWLEAHTPKGYDSVVWYLPDSQRISGKQITYFPSAPMGRERVHFLAYNSRGCSAWCTDTLDFGAEYQPRAAIALTDSSLCQWRSIQFADSSRADTIAGGGARWAWTFGDGTTSAAQHPRKVCTKPGIYSIRLVYSNGYCYDTADTSIVVQAAPRPSLVLSDTMLCTNLSLSAGYGLNEAYDSLIFTTGDGRVFRTPTPAWQYSEPGWYNVKLTLYNGLCHTLDSQRVRVAPSASAVAIQHLSVIGPDDAELWWNSTSAKRYTIERSTDGRTWATLTSTTDTFFTDGKTPVSDGPVSYRIRATDSCGALGPQSLGVPTIHLSGTVEPLNNELRWTAPLHWPSGADHFALYRTGPAGHRVALDSAISPVVLRYTDDAPLDLAAYQVTAWNAARDSSLSNVITLELPLTITIPNAFSPNADGLNDSFLPIGRGFQNFELTIFNRWGERLYSGTQGWDGTYRNSIVPGGVYLYTLLIQPTGPHRSLEFRSGTVEVVR